MLACSASGRTYHVDPRPASNPAYAPPLLYDPATAGIAAAALLRHFGFSTEAIQAMSRAVLAKDASTIRRKTAGMTKSPEDLARDLIALGVLSHAV